MISIGNKSKNFYVVFLLTLIALLVAVVAGIQYGMHAFLITALVLSICYKGGEKLLYDWLPYIVLFYVYEIGRANAYEIGQRIGIASNLQIQSIIDLEKKIFFFWDRVPTVELQSFFKPDLSSPQIYDYFFFFFYGVVFFAFWGLTGLAIWRFKQQYFKRFMIGLLAFSFASILVFILLPTAPPWYASELGYIEPVQRILWEFQYIPGHQLGSVNDIGSNLFAAIPSLHTGWPVYVALWIMKVWGKKTFAIILVPIIIAFATWYGAEHYVIDSIVGAFMGLIFFLISAKWDRINKILHNNK